MDIRQQILDTPRALRGTFEKSKPEFEAIIRQVRWGEGPVFLVGTGSSYYASLSAALAFESLLGWPVVARPAAEFEAFTASALRQRSVVLAVSGSGETEETVSAARAARARGAVILAFTNNQASTLAQTADFAFLTRAGAPGETGLLAVISQHAALGYLVLLAARILKRHHQQLDVLDDEYSKLAGHLESLPIQLSDAVSALAREWQNLRGLSFVGGGFYFPIALQIAALVREHSGLRAGADGLGDSLGDDRPQSPEEHAIVLLSGSHDRLKKRVQILARGLQDAGVKTFAVTDANHRELVQATSLSILIPGLSEMVGSTVELALLASAVAQLVRAAARSAKPHVKPMGARNPI